MQSTTQPHPNYTNVNMTHTKGLRLTRRAAITRETRYDHTIFGVETSMKSVAMNEMRI